MRADPQRGRKLGHGNSSSPDGSLSLLWLFESASNEHLPEKIAQGNIPPSLQGQINPSFDEFFFAGRHGRVEADEVSFSNAI